MELETFKSFAAALAIGALIGLERERAKISEEKAAASEEAAKEGPAPEGAAGRTPEFAGIRTFPLIALCGALLAHLTTFLGPAVFIAGFAAFTLLVVAAYHQIASASSDRGITTAMSALLVFALSGLCVFGPLELCGALAILVYLILALKPPLRSLVRRVEAEDIYAIGKFGAVTLLVLPLLPDRTYGPFDVLNPYKIWLMVVLIAAISLVGYLAVKILGTGRGFGLTGFLGGLVSSTAVTLSFSEKSRQYPALALPSALAIVLACSMLVPRVLVVSALIDARLVAHLWMPLAAMLTVSLGAAVLIYRRARTTQVEQHAVELKNPFELGPAVKFAGIFVIVLFGAKLLQHYLGNAGLYISGAAAGITDVDAIVLSMGRLSADGSIPAEVAVTGITLAVMSNTLTKAAMAFFLAGPGTRIWVSVTLVLQALAGGAVILGLALLPAAS